MFRAATSVAQLVLALALSAPVAAQEWPQWRGPFRDGRIVGFSPPPAWPPSLTQSWKTLVGEGHSSPVVAGGRVYIHSREDGREVVRAIALATGRELWRDSYAVSYSVLPEAAVHGAGPKATPVAGNQALFTVGISGVVSSYDLASGKLRWRVDSARQFDDRTPAYGMTVSPVLHGNLLIAHLGHEKSGALVGFDAATGVERWRWSGGSPSYASPVVADIGGTVQIICLSYRSIAGVVPQTGAVLWQIPYAAVNIPHAMTPVVYRDTILVAGYSKGVTAFRVVKQGDNWTTEEAWRNADVSISMSTPVLSGDLLLGLADRNRGQVFCLDARTGETKWTSPGREGESAAVLVADRHLLVFKTDGSLVVANADGRRFEPVARYQVSDGQVWSVPAVVGRDIFVKDGDSLAAWSFPNITS